MKKLFAPLLAVLLLFTFAACGKAQPPAAGAPLILADFVPYKNGKAQDLPANGTRLEAGEDNATTLRGIAVGDGVDAIAAEYGGVPCDIDYYDGAGASVNLNRATMEAFVHEAQPAKYTVTYLLLEVGGATYAYDALEDAPEEQGAFTFHYLLFDIEDGIISAIILYTANIGQE